MMKKSNMFAISGIKKVASLCLAMSLLTLVGCGSDNDSHESKITTEEYSTEAEEKLTVDEANQKIDDGAVLPDATTEAETTEATTEAETPAVNNGSYSYTIYDGIEVTLPFDIDDWVITADKGYPGFQAYYLATGCGWVSIDDRDDYFYYDCGDYYAYFQLEEPYEEECGYEWATDKFHVYQAKSCQLWFSPKGEPGEWYFGQVPSGSEKSSIEIDYGMHYSDCQYIYLGSKPNTALSRDDMIMIAYLLTFVSSNPEKGNPVYYLTLTDSVAIGSGGRLTHYELP